MLCRNEERPDNDERFIAILSSVSFIMLKKGDYIKAKAFAEQVELYPLLHTLHHAWEWGWCQNSDQDAHHENYHQGSLRPAYPHRPLCTLWSTLQHVWGHRYDDNEEDDYEEDDDDGHNVVVLMVILGVVGFGVVKVL